MVPSPIRGQRKKRTVMRIFEAGKTAVLAGLVASFVTLPGTAYALDENTVIQEQEKRSPWAVFRFAFSAYKRGDKEEALEEISWDEFFRIFEDSDLALLAQDQTSGGETSRFSKFVQR